MTSLTAYQGIVAEVVVLDDIVQAAYGRDRRDLARAYKANPSNFLRGLAVSISSRISSCSGVPIITGSFSKFWIDY
jgi:aspartate kinase